MNEMFSTFGVMAFIAFVVIIFFIGREYLKLRKENKQLQKDLSAYSAALSELAEASKLSIMRPSEPMLYEKLLTEDKEECQKS